MAKNGDPHITILTNRKLGVFFFLLCLRQECIIYYVSFIKALIVYRRYGEFVLCRVYDQDNV